MAMVFSRDVLFVHVPKTGGTSVAAYLLRVLPKPVSYVASAPVGGDEGPFAGIAPDGLVHLYGPQHQTLPEARTFLGERGIDLTSFPMILAVVRNPYDLAVSKYHYNRSETLPYAFIDRRDAPPAPPLPLDGWRNQEMETLVGLLAPDRIARIEPVDREERRTVLNQLFQTAARLGRPVEAWDQDGALFARSLTSVPRTGKATKLAKSVDFKRFLVEQADRAAKRDRRPRLYDFYHLDGGMPSNLRLVRFERLAEEVREALRSTGINTGAEFPWLNRSDHAPYASYYDAETEAIVYERNRWVFDAGLYERLDLGSAAAN